MNPASLLGKKHFCGGNLKLKNTGPLDNWISIFLPWQDEASKTKTTYSHKSMFCAIWKFKILQKLFQYERISAYHVPLEI